MAPIAASLWRNLRVFQVFGANTDVGKTILSTILCRAVLEESPADKLWYLKPVSTGALDDADIRHLERYAPQVKTQNFYQFDDPVSPHLAARVAKDFVKDGTLLHKIVEQINLNAANGSGFMLVETAGGSTSPGPSGTPQADLYRPLRLPTVLIADSRLGGISTSISSYESLHIRGYDVEGVAVFSDSYYKNYEYFQSYFGDRDIPVLVVEKPPERAENDEQTMNTYYNSTVTTQNAAPSTTPLSFVAGLNTRHHARVQRLETLAGDAFHQIWWPFTQHKTLSPQNITTIDSAHGDYFQTVGPANTSVLTETSPEINASSVPPPVLRSTLDASASWWTQGLGHGNPALTMAAAHAAGRYGHVMFAEAIHEPALSLASSLIKLTNNPRLQRTFYSDNGSTGMEVAVKMALKAADVRYEWEKNGPEAEILGLQGSYHGDTMGAMDMSEPSVYNEKIPWYKGRGYWFEAPSVRMQQGKWVVTKPAGLERELGKSTTFDSLQDVFHRRRDDANDAFRYENYLRQKLEQLTQKEKRRFGALVMEPVVLGAGGMVLVDPLFQRILTSVIRSSTSLFSTAYDTLSPSPGSTTWSGLPIIADEVFTGLYRLGQKTACSLLGIHPDISVHAKLLTGGLVPLCATLASESVFEAFLADGKADALLHGHSYTAHPVGCAVAGTAVKELRKLEESGQWDVFKEDWRVGGGASSVAASIVEKVAGVVSTLGLGGGGRGFITAEEDESSPYEDGRPSRHARPVSPKVWSVWSQSFVTALSHAARVEGVWALGSVLAITLRDEAGGGYTSTAAKGVQKELLESVSQRGGLGADAEIGVGWNVHARVLGNVLYLMSSQTSSVEDVRLWEERVAGVLGVSG